MSWDRGCAKHQGNTDQKRSRSRIMRTVAITCTLDESNFFEEPVWNKEVKSGWWTHRVRRLESLNAFGILPLLHFVPSTSSRTSY